jgi:hypothetical protein
MLTEKDLAAIGNLIGVVVDQKDLVSKKDIGVLVSHLPTKDDFYAETEKIYKKLEDIEMEKNVLVRQVRRQDERIDFLEDIHPDGKHKTL